jgi:hypothetical protein
MKRLAKLIEEMDNLLGHIEGINDERDSVPLLLEIRRRWPQIKAEIEDIAWPNRQPLAAEDQRRWRRPLS